MKHLKIQRLILMIILNTINLKLLNPNPLFVHCLPTGISTWRSSPGPGYWVRIVVNIKQYGFIADIALNKAARWGVAWEKGRLKGDRV